MRWDEGTFSTEQSSGIDSEFIKNLHTVLGHWPAVGEALEASLWHRKLV